VQGLKRKGEDEHLVRYRKTLEDRKSILNHLVVEIGLERAKLIIEDKKRGRKSGQMSWWLCTE
jgi:hypothetical protein